ncbi:hypothetical protein AAE478_009780 [Parahypoxylon ruwenzoriense]
MAAVKDSFLDLERHRKKLEENVDKLSKALDHWKQWRDEYEALRSRVKSLPSSASRQELKKTREQFEGELLNEKELVDLFGHNDSSKAEQIISKLTNRLDYVIKNIDTLSKQLETAENRLAAVTVVANPDATDEDGLPITEIMEELDDDDNVISYTLRTPGDSQPQILEALEKVGIKDFSPDTRATQVPEVSQDVQGGESGSSKSPLSPPVRQPQLAQDSKSEVSKSAPSPPPQQPEKSQSEEAMEKKPVAKKKSVAFTEDTKSGEQQQELSETTKRLEEILQKAKDQQTIISNPIFPADESPEDSALREDMIRYNKETMEFEMAPIVAELQLEEGSTGDGTDYSDYDDDDEGNEEEDQWGRTKITFDDDWKRQMLELKERLSKHTFGKGKASDDEDELVEGIGRISIRRETDDVSNGDTDDKPSTTADVEDVAPAKDTKKNVRFSQGLDIAEEPRQAAKQAAPERSRRSRVDPLSDVTERKSGTAQPVVAPTKKPSRFRQGRGKESHMNAKVPSFNGAPIAPDKPDDRGNYTPSGPEGQTLATSVLEHEPSLEVKEPDEFDANMLHKQVTEEYHKMRNKFIYRQGGFMKEDENPIQPLDEEVTGPKQMSRFKAARLGR